MSPEHREIRESLGSWAMGHLEPAERERVDLHLETCPECRAEARSLEKTGLMLELVDPAVVDSLAEPLPVPPPELEARVMEGLTEEVPNPEGKGRRPDTHREGRRRWIVLPAAGALAAVAAIALVLVLGGGDKSRPVDESQQFAFSSLPPGVSIAGSMEPRATGTGIVVNVDGMKPGTLCRVYVKTSAGKLEPAGTFRYRYDGEEGESYPATLSIAWDLSEINQLVIKAGSKTFSTDV